MICMNMAIPMNVVNTSKKGNLIGTHFHLFYTNNTTAYLYDAEWAEPIVWGSKTVVRSIAKQLGRKDLLNQSDPYITISIYLPVEKMGAMKMRFQYSGLLSGLIMPGY